MLWKQSATFDESVQKCAKCTQKMKNVQVVYSTNVDIKPFVHLYTFFGINTHIYISEVR